MPTRYSRRASFISANSPCARRRSTCAAAASRSAYERMARRGAVERAGARSRRHAGFCFGQGARPRVDEPRGAGKNGGDRGSRLLVATVLDRKSTRLNSSHSQISYAVFCLKKKILIDTLITFAMLVLF